MTKEKRYAIINIENEKEEKNMNMNINNKPAYADDYEFIVARKDNNEFWFWGAYEDGFIADKAAHEINGVIFHNVRIQGKRNK